MQTTDLQRRLTSDMYGFSLKHLPGTGGNGQGVRLHLSSAGKDEDGSHVLEARACRDGRDVALDPVRLAGSSLALADCAADCQAEFINCQRTAQN